jgi:rhodanese-related sulfurtransferase
LENGCAVEAPTLLDQRSRWQFATRALCLILFTAVGVAAADVARAATTAVPDVSAIDDGSTKANELFSGIECLQNAGTLLGRSPDMIDLLRAAKSSSEGGSTAKQLASIGTAQHLNAIVLDHISADQIARCPYPIMLHVKGGRYSSQPDYYVLCTGTRGGRVNLFDPPSRQSVITLSQLEEDRRAEAIILSGERLPPAAGYLHRSVPLATYGLMIAATAGMGVLAVACRRRPRGSTGRSGLRHVWASSLQLLGISIASLLLSFVCQSASGRALLPASDGLATEPIDFIMPGTAPGAHSIVDPPEISVAVALQMINRNALFVDARDPAEYNAGHIRGAVLCPATDVGRWHVHLAGIDLHRRIIVYCAEASCHKGEYVATFLLSCGFSDVSLYRAGWAQWTGPKEAQ